MELLIALLALFIVVSFAIALQWWTYRRHSQAQQRDQQAHRRALATLDNEHKAHTQRLRREAEKEQSATALALAMSLLPALDAQQQAIQSAQETEGANQEIAAGLQLVQQAFVAALQAHKITPVTPQPGDTFDPQQHEAIGMLSTADLPEGSIAAIVRAGWTHPRRLLRPAMVQIAQSPPRQDLDEEPTK